MIPGCAVILAGLCVAAPFDRATQLHAMYAYTDGRTGVADPDLVRRLGVQIDLWRSDNLVAKDTTGGRRACGDAGCVVYIAVCSQDGLDCRYEWKADTPHGFEGATGTLTMHARSEVEMEHARNAVFVRTGAGIGDWISSVSLTADPANLLPECGDETVARCYNPFVGLWPPVPRQR